MLANLNYVTHAHQHCEGDAQNGWLGLAFGTRGGSLSSTTVSDSICRMRSCCIGDPGIPSKDGQATRKSCGTSSRTHTHTHTHPHAHAHAHTHTHTHTLHVLVLKYIPLLTCYQNLSSAVSSPALLKIVISNFDSDTSYFAMPSFMHQQSPTYLARVRARVSALRLKLPSIECYIGYISKTCPRRLLEVSPCLTGLCLKISLRKVRLTLGKARRTKLASVLSSGGGALPR